MTEREEKIWKDFLNFLEKQNNEERLNFAKQVYHIEKYPDKYRFRSDVLTLNHLIWIWNYDYKDFAEHLQRLRLV